MAPSRRRTVPVRGPTDHTLGHPLHRELEFSSLVCGEAGASRERAVYLFICALVAAGANKTKQPDLFRSPAAFEFN